MKAKTLQVCLVILVLAFVGCASGGGSSSSGSSAAAGIVLKPKDATIHTERPIPSLTIEEPNGNFGYWNFTDEYPSWDVSIPAAGKYMVTLRYAAWSTYAGSPFFIEVGGQKLEGTLASTSAADDGWFAFKNMDLGVVDLKAGDTVLEMKVTEVLGGQAACNLLKITLTPQ